MRRLRRRPPLPQLSLHSPLGALTLTQEEDAIVALDWGWASDQRETGLLVRAREQLDAYFDGALTRFALPLTPAGGTAYRRRIWAALAAIPFGETRTYGEIARTTGGCARSIGQANRHNPLPILIPCHRVIASSHLGGFSMQGGLETKRFLLGLETAACAGSAPPAAEAA